MHSPIHLPVFSIIHRHQIKSRRQVAWRSLPAPLRRRCTALLDNHQKLIQQLSSYNAFTNSFARVHRRANKIKAPSRLAITWASAVAAQVHVKAPDNSHQKLMAVGAISTMHSPIHLPVLRLTGAQQNQGASSAITWARAVAAQVQEVPDNHQIPIQQLTMHLHHCLCSDHSALNKSRRQVAYDHLGQRCCGGAGAGRS
jgi:hypothetical protein